MTSRAEPALPRYADTVVVGGGTAGAVVAGRLAEQSGRTILLLEAGPDYGPYLGGGWPEGLLDARVIPREGHDWGYVSAARYCARELPLERARVLGGCSAHNGCAAIWGSRDDYDEWERRGNAGWGAEALLPLFRAVDERLRVRVPPPHELTPWQRAVLAAAPGIGIPPVDNLNDLDGTIGIGASPANIANGVRWNTAFAYLDPVRDRPNLTICGHTVAERVALRGEHVAAVEVIGPRGPARVETRQVVLCAGAYGSPAVLLRSGIGPADELAALGISPVHVLPGVGHNLHDHPALLLRYAGSPEIIAAMERFVAEGGWLPEEQTIAKARSSFCQGPFDLHLYPTGGAYGSGADPWVFMLPVANLTPLSRGSVRLSGTAADDALLIDHGYLTDEEDRDLAVLLDGVELARRLAAQAPLCEAIGAELAPGPGVLGRDDLRAYIRANGVHYYHPVGTCAMGPAGEAMAVADACGRVHGLEGLLVADASLMPVVPRANTNVPSAVVGEKIAASIKKEPGHVP